MQPIAFASSLILSIMTQTAPAVPPAKSSEAPVVKAAEPYHVLRTIPVGGEGGWDCVAIDPETHWLYVPRSTRVMVIDTESGKTVGEIADTSGVHAVALAPQLGKGFTSNGKTDDVTVFDLKTLKTVKTVKAGKNPDEIIFEPVTKRVFVFNGKSDDATVISAEDLSIVGTLPLGGKPELGAVDGAGKVFVNLEDKSEVLRIDAKTLKIEQRIALAPGEEPTGLAIDRVHHQLFAACHNEKMIAVDSESGKVLAVLPIGKGVDGAGFDPSGTYAFASNGEGTLTVIRTSEVDGLKPFTVVQTLPTAPGARTQAVDPKSHQIYLPTSEYEAPAKDAKAGTRPKMKPGSFKIVVVGR